MSNITVNEFKKTVSDTEILESAISNTDAYNEQLLNNSLTDSKNNSNINKKEAEYFDLESLKYDNYIIIIKIVYYILVCAFIIKNLTTGEKYADKVFWVLAISLLIYPYILSDSQYIYTFISSKLK